MTTRKDLLNSMRYETETAKRYAASALKQIEARNLGKALNLIEVAKCATNCAMQSHDAFWELLGEDMTSEEFEVFCEAETCCCELQKLVKAYQLARK